MIDPYINPRSRRSLSERPVDPVRDAIENGEYAPGVVEFAVKSEISRHNAAMLSKTNDPEEIARIAASQLDPNAPLEEVELGTLENAMRSLTLAEIEVPEEDAAYRYIVERVKEGYTPEHLAKVQDSLASYGIRLTKSAK